MSIKSWYNNLIGNKKSLTLSGPVWYFGTNGEKILVSDNKGDYMKEGFGTNSTVYSIIKMISDKFATLPFYLYEIKDKKYYARYKSLSQGMYEGGSLIEYERTRKKALREVDKHPFLEAFDKLGFEGKAQLCGFRDMSGDAFLWKNRGLSNSGAPIEYKLLPSQFMNIESDGLFNVSGYVLNLGQQHKYTPQEVAHWKYWNPFFDTQGGHLYGLSPLRAGFMDLMTSKAGKNAAYNDFTNNGIKGAIVRNEDNPWNSEQRDDVNKYVDEKFNGADNRGKIRAMNIKASWMQMGMSVSEMETMKALQLTKEDLCNIYQFPVRMLAGVEGTMNNVETSGKQLITGCVYPRAASFRDFVNTQLLPDFGDNGKLFYDVDITALPELQDEMKQLYELMNMADWVSMEEKREMTNWDESNEPLMKKFYIKNDKTPIDQMNSDLGGSINNDLQDLNNAGVKDY